MSVNRDLVKFEWFDIFVVYCKINFYVSFGFGIYFCLGVLLVRMEGKIVFIKLLEKGGFFKV